MRTLCLALLIPMGLLHAQVESRGAIFGHVTDPMPAMIAGAKVRVTNTLTNVATELTTNAQGYYEAPLLLAGTYRVEVSAPGFRSAARPAFDLPAGSRMEVDFRLEIGAVSDTVTVNDAPPLLNTDNTSTGLVVDRRSVRELPWPGGNPMMLVWMAPGAQTGLSIADHSQRLHSGGPAGVSINGRVGGNEFTVDGTPNNANARSVGYNPAPEFVQAVKVETSGFDASFGHSTGAAITMITNSGTNKLHGVLREMHEQFKWRATDLFVKQGYYRRIAQAEAAGNRQLADDIRRTPPMQPGRENSYAGSIGGPIVIPKLINGKDKLFFFYGFAGFRVGEYRQQYFAFPTADMRTGNFSQLLNINANQYQIYDPYSTVADPARPTHVIRTPFAGNIVPASRIINPSYRWVAGYLPLPNEPAANNQEPNRNFNAYNFPYTEKYDSHTNRYDYNRQNDRFFLRWSYNRWQNSVNGRWMFYTDGPNIGKDAGNIRSNLNAAFDWVHTFGGSTLLNVTVGSNQTRQENVNPALNALKPSDIGFPGYLDETIADTPNLPVINWSGWSPFGPTVSPFVSRWRVLSFKSDVSHMKTNHTIKAGFDARGQFFTGFNPGNNAGTFNYTSTFTTRTDDALAASGTGAYGGSWASFMMGLPASSSLDVNASQAYGNPYFAAFVHDTWRVTPKLTLNLGLRMEYELGPTDRYNRLIGPFDAQAELPITAAARAAYARVAIPEVPLAAFSVLGGASNPGLNGAPRRLWNNYLVFLPRFAAAYQIRPRTVLRTGYGLFADTLNVQNETFNQLGYSWATSAIYTNDFGQNWLVGNPGAGVSPMNNPFPLRADGTRFDTPPGARLGPMAPAGRGFTFAPFDRPHALQQRWRLDMQHQISNTMMINIGYAGSYSDQVPINQTMSALPAQYWAFGNSRNDAVANNLNTNIVNPFQISNFAGIRTSNPMLYQLMSTNPFFTSATIRKSALLSPYAHMNGLTQTVPLGKVRTHELNASFQRNYANGSSFIVNYTKLYNYAADYFPNAFDQKPAWQPSNAGRPHRLTGTAVLEMPFGKRRRWAQQGVGAMLLGGFQLTAMGEYQPGELLTWSPTLFYTGDLQDICSGGPRSIGQWFQTSGFVTVASQTANTGQARVFPNIINGYGGCRGDSMKRVNSSLQRQFSIKERARLELRWDVYNTFNQGQLGLPNRTPTSTDFGRITTSMNGGGGSPTLNRSMRVQVRLLF